MKLLETEASTSSYIDSLRGIVLRPFLMAVETTVVGEQKLLVVTLTTSCRFAIRIRRETAKMQVAGNFC